MDPINRMRTNRIKKIDGQACDSTFAACGDPAFISLFVNRLNQSPFNIEHSSPKPPSDGYAFHFALDLPQVCYLACKGVLFQPY